MDNSLVKKTHNELKFDAGAIDLIKRTIAVGATNDELSLFLHQSQKSGLDPLARQIYFVKRGGKTTIQTSIDGLRLVAQRSGDYAGQDEPEFEDNNGKLKIARVRIYKFNNGQRYQAAVGVAYWDEYCPQSGQDFMWKKMPHTMLAKVAEALALRKAFPQELSGLYSKEEMDQSGPEEAIIAPKSASNGVKKEEPSIDGVTIEGEVDPPGWLDDKEEEVNDQPTEDVDEVAQEALKCKDCGKDITEKVHDYSLEKFGNPLCFTDQNKYKI